MGHTGQRGRRKAFIAAGVALALGLAACEAPSDPGEAYEDEAPAAGSVDDVAVDAAAEVEPGVPETDENTAPATPPADPDAADSVQPESETLFY